MKITGSTRTVAIFGHPIAHTMSPVIQNAAFREAGVDGVYLAFHVLPENLAEAVAGARAMGFMGLNITVPHKVAVMEHLDSVDEGARAIGAVNTVVNRDGRLVGYNTDGAGYLSSLATEMGFTPRGKNVVILGAGGAARAILHAVLAGEPASVVIANRTVKKASDLADEFSSVAPDATVDVCSLDAKALSGPASGADLVVNTTSMGMDGSPGPDFPVDSMPEYGIVSDIVYKPLETEILGKALDRGLRAHRGLGMLIHQGALGFRLWTGKDAPVETMKNAAMKALGLAAPEEEHPEVRE